MTLADFDWGRVLRAGVPALLFVVAALAVITPGVMPEGRGSYSETRQAIYVAVIAFCSIILLFLALRLLTAPLRGKAVAVDDDYLTVFAGTFRNIALADITDVKVEERRRRQTVVLYLQTGREIVLWNLVMRESAESIAHRIRCVMAQRVS